MLIMCLMLNCYIFHGKHYVNGGIKKILYESCDSNVYVNKLILKYPKSEAVQTLYVPCIYSVMMQYYKDIPQINPVRESRKVVVEAILG